MAAKALEARDWVVKIYDGTTPTPFTVTISFLGNFSGPFGRLRPEEVIQVDNGVGSSLVHTTVATDANIFTNPTITLGGKLYEPTTLQDVLVALSDPFDSATWKPGGTSVFVGVTTLGTVPNADGSDITLPPPRDTVKLARMVNIEALGDADTDFLMKYAGVYFDPSKITWDKGEDGSSTFSAEGEVFGAITTGTAFSTGTAVT